MNHFFPSCLMTDAFSPRCDQAMMMTTTEFDPLCCLQAPAVKQAPKAWRFALRRSFKQGLGSIRIVAEIKAKDPPDLLLYVVEI